MGDATRERCPRRGPTRRAGRHSRTGAGSLRVRAGRASPRRVPGDALQPPSGPGSRAPPPRRRGRVPRRRLFRQQPRARVPRPCPMPFPAPASSGPASPIDPSDGGDLVGGSGARPEAFAPALHGSRGVDSRRPPAVITPFSGRLLKSADICPAATPGWDVARFRSCGPRIVRKPGYNRRFSAGQGKDPPSPAFGQETATIRRWNKEEE